MGEDTELCKDIIENSLKIESESYNIVKFMRLGTRSEDGGRPRPTLVKLEDEKQKWKIMKSAKNLKDERDPVKKPIGIVSDLTEMEREIERNLRQQLKEKKQQGEEDQYIKNGKLCRARMEERRRY